jgi:signal transduction histidine kinase/ligand-binding sensor domain-containing protein/AraC-like DNA-binding protein
LFYLSKILGIRFFNPFFNKLIALNYKIKNLRFLALPTDMLNLEHLIRCKKHKLLFSFFILIIGLFDFHKNIYAQELKFSHISNEDGLSNSTVESILQDSRGFLWFGTRDGLNKYDGHKITVYKNLENDSNSISDNFIRCIYQDSRNNLWIGTSRGLNQFDAKHNKFIRHPISLPQNSIQDLGITAIFEDHLKNLWVGTSGGGLYHLDKDYKFKSLKYPDKEKQAAFSFINYITEYNQHLIIATDKGAWRYHSKNGTFKFLSSLKNYTIRTMAKDKKGGLWIGTEEKGLIFYSESPLKLKQYTHQDTKEGSLGSDLVRAVLISKNNQIWVGGINGGLNLFNPKDETFSHYQNEPGNPTSLSQRTVSALYEDKQGNLWVGTHRGGVNLYSKHVEKFRIIRQQPNKNSLSYNDVKAFCEDKKGNIWIGTDGGGLNFFNRTTNTFTVFKNNPFNPKSLATDAVLHIMDSDDDLLIGTWGGGLNMFNKKTQTFTRFTTNTKRNKNISSNYVQNSFKDSKNNIWVGTYYGGLNLFDKTKGEFTRVIWGNNQESQLYGNNVISIIEDKDQNLWIGTDDGGLNKYNLNTRKFSHYFNDEVKKPDLRVLFIDRKNRLWVGQTGLYLYNKTKDTFNIFTNKAGLATEIIKGITEDKLGNLWISTSNGLTKINPETLAFKKYNTADGLQGLEFEANAYLKTNTGEMFFGGINGFNYFYPENIKTNTFKPPVYITSLYIFNQLVLPEQKNSPLTEDISYTQNIELNYQQSSISFDFAALNYVASENNLYAYQMDGMDKDWNYVGHNTRASYTNLDPGNYTFKVKAANNDGIWNDKVTAINVYIAPPFWQTWWFRILVTASLIYITYLILNFKRKLEIKAIEEEKREEMHQMQLQFFTNISHEFRTPLSLILGPIDCLLKEDIKSGFKDYYQTIHRNANRLLHLINELMDFRKVETGALKLKVSAGNITSFADEIAEEFMQMAKEKNILLTIKEESALAEIWFDKHILEKILLNLVNNSLKYTPEGGRILIEISNSDAYTNLNYAHTLKVESGFNAKQYLFIKVADNGIGISAESIQHLFERYYRTTESHMGSGVGLAFVKNLTLLHKGLILVSSEKNKGTEIVIGIPALKDDYSFDECWNANISGGGTRLESIIYPTEKVFEIEAEKDIPLLRTQQQKHILIVDDNDELRSFLKDTLSTDYMVSEANNGQSGIEKAQTVFPDLIISDIMMPGMNGIEFCKFLKDDLETSHIPFLMLTAKNSVEAHIEGAVSGADYYFTKPININLLQVTLKNIFDQKRKLKEHYQKNQNSEARELAHSLKDKEFMDKLIAIIHAQLPNPNLDTDYLCSEINMSKTRLYHKIKTITGQSTGEFIRTIRLRKSVEIMTHEDVILTEVMYRVGIQTQSYFTKAFKKEFGKTPSQYLQDLKRK